jgi:hypothetical protein
MPAEIGAGDLQARAAARTKNDVGDQRAVVGIARGLESVGAAGCAGDHRVEIDEADAEPRSVGDDVCLWVGQGARRARPPTLPY